MAELAFTVYLSEPKTARQVSFGPGDEVPEWAAKLIGPHAYEGYDPENPGQATGDGDGPPPQAGRGSGTDAWLAYARANDVEVADDAARQDIVDACREAGVNVGDD